MTAPQQENREPSRFRLTRLRIVVLVLIALSLLARITLPSILTPLLDDFTEAGEEQIAQIAELLIEHPTLAVSMGGQVGPLDQDSDEFVPGDGRLDELAHDRAERLSEILSVKFEVDPEQLRIDPQIHVGDPGVAIELVPR